MTKPSARDVEVLDGGGDDGDLNIWELQYKKMNG